MLSTSSCSFSGDELFTIHRCLSASDAVILFSGSTYDTHKGYPVRAGSRRKTATLSMLVSKSLPSALTRLHTERLMSNSPRLMRP